MPYRFKVAALALLALVASGSGATAVVSEEGEEEGEVMAGATARTRGEAMYERWRLAYRECRRATPVSSSSGEARLPLPGGCSSSNCGSNSGSDSFGDSGGVDNRTVVWSALNAPTLGNTLSGFLPAFGEALRSDARLVTADPAASTSRHESRQQARLARFLRLGLPRLRAATHVCLESPLAACDMSVRVLGGGASAAHR
jgi:hypothetical protein